MWIRSFVTSHDDLVSLPLQDGSEVLVPAQAYADTRITREAFALFTHVFSTGWLSGFRTRVRWIDLEDADPGATGSMRLANAAGLEWLRCLGYVDDTRVEVVGGSKRKVLHFYDHPSMNPELIDQWLSAGGHASNTAVVTAVDPSRVRQEMRRNRYRLLGVLSERDGYRCRECGYVGPYMEIDHIYPVSLGGANDLDNLQLLCKSCNSRKSAKVVGTGIGEGSAERVH